MKVIVTGHCGFIGRYLTDRLLKQGYEVFGIDIRDPSDVILINDPNFKQIKVDICDINALKDKMSSLKDISFVFHTVAVQPVSKDTELLKYIQVNLIGTMNLLKCCEENNIKDIIASSSFSVYGQPLYIPMDEKHPAKPQNPYGLSKLQAELAYEYYARRLGFNIVILRYDGVYGIGQTIPGFIEYLFNFLSKDEDVELFNKGQQKRDNVYVGDVVEANLLAVPYLAKENFSIFNIGGCEPKKSHETAEKVKEELGSKGNIIISDKGNPLLSYDVYMTSKKAIEELGYKPKTLSENIKEMKKISEGK